MKKATKLLIALCTLTAAFSALAACGGTATADIDAPGSFKLRNAKLSWKAVDGVTYEVSTDGKNYVAVEEDEVNLLDIVNSTSVTKIYVRGAVGKAKGPVAEYPITVQTLGTPEKATYEFDQESRQRRLVWDEVEEADKYEVLVTTDGVEASKWVTYTTNYYSPTKTGEYTIKVRCKGYSDGDILYIPGGVSEVSESITMLTAPVLQVTSVNRITWSSETQFDSYNLLIQDKNGVEVKHENVTITGVDLDLVTNEYITATGEYDITIEAMKDGEPYYSNTYVEFGTTNINENEFYSFDNRKVNSTAAQAGVTISNEEYYGKAEGKVGYSLKIDGADDSVTGQYNFVRYDGSGVNKWITSNITKISYKIFIPAGQIDANGAEVTSVKYTDMPAWRWEEVIGKIGEDAMGGYATKMFYDDTKTESYEVGKWHEITITGENLDSDVVLIMSWGYFKNADITAYIDEITVEGYEDRSSIVKAKDNMATVCPDADLVMSVSRGTIVYQGWQDGSRVALDFGVENAGKKVDISFQAKGTANGEKWPDTGFVLLTEARGNEEGKSSIGVDANGNGIEKENYVHSVNRGITAFQQMDEWQTITIKNVTLNNLGKVWLDPFADFSGPTNNLDCTVADEFNAYIKGATITVLPEHDQRAYNHGTANDKVNNKGINLKLDKAQYDTTGKVQWTNVTMKVMGDLSADFEDTVGFVAYGWAVDNGYPGDTKTLPLTDAATMRAAFKSNEYVEITVRVPHYYDTPVYLVPAANGYGNPLNLFVKDITADYTTISDFMEWSAEDAIQVAKEGEKSANVFVKGTFDKVQLVINGKVESESITTGIVDLSSYLTKGSYTVKFVGIKGETTVESNELTYAIQPEGTEYFSYYGGVAVNDKNSNKAAHIKLDQSKFFKTTNPDKAGTTQWVTVTMKVQGTLDLTNKPEGGWVNLYCYGWAIDNGYPGESYYAPHTAEAQLAGTAAFGSDEWTTVTFRFPHYHNTDLFLVPVASYANPGAFYVFIKDVEIDYSTVSTIAKPTSDVEIKLGEGETIDTYIKGAYETVQLKVNGTVVAENATITAGTIDVASYVGMGSNEISIVVDGVESNKVNIAKAPEGTEYTAWTSGTVNDKGNKGAALNLDDSKFFKGTNANRAGTVQWVTVTMDVQGTLNLTNRPENGWATFCVYGWGLGAQTPGDAIYAPMNDTAQGIAGTLAMAGNEWTTITLRIPHYHDSNEVLVPVATWSAGSYYVFIKNVKVDYTTISTIKAPKSEIEIKKNGETAIDTYFAKAYDSLQLQVNGTVVNDNLTVNADGSIDVASYLGTGVFKFKLIGITGDATVESNELEYITLPDDVEVYAYNGDGVAASKETNIAAEIKLDQDKFTYHNDTLEYVNISMKIKGTLAADFDGATGMKVYGWAIDNGLKANVAFVKSPTDSWKLLYKSQEWVEIIIRVPHYHNTDVWLMPELSPKAEAGCYVFFKDIVVDYTTVSTSTVSPITYAQSSDGSYTKGAVAKFGYEVAKAQEAAGTTEWISNTFDVTVDVKLTANTEGYEGGFALRTWNCSLGNNAGSNDAIIVEGDLNAALSGWTTLKLSVTIGHSTWEPLLMPYATGSWSNGDIVLEIKNFVWDYASLPTKATFVQRTLNNQTKWGVWYGAIPVDAPVGTIVTLDMDVLVKLDSSNQTLQYGGSLSTVDIQWSDYTSRITRTILDKKNATGTWQHITAQVMVVNYAKGIYGTAGDIPADSFLMPTDTNFIMLYWGNMYSGGSLAYKNVEVTIPDEPAAEISATGAYHSLSSKWSIMDLSDYAGKEVTLTLKGKGTATAENGASLVYGKAYAVDGCSVVAVNAFTSTEWSEFTFKLTVPESGMIYYTAGCFSYTTAGAFDAYVQLVKVVDPNAPVEPEVPANPFEGTTWTDESGYRTATFADGKVTFTGFSDSELDNIAWAYTVNGNVVSFDTGSFTWDVVTFTVDGDKAVFADGWGSSSYTFIKDGAVVEPEEPEVPEEPVGPTTVNDATIIYRTGKETNWGVWYLPIKVDAPVGSCVTIDMDVLVDFNEANNNYNAGAGLLYVATQWADYSPNKNAVALAAADVTGAWQHLRFDARVVDFAGAWYPNLPEGSFTVPTDSNYVLLAWINIGKGAKISYGDVEVTVPQTPVYHISATQQWHNEASIWTSMDLTKYAGKEVVLTLKGRGTAPAGTKDALIFTNAWSIKDTATVKVAGTDLNVFESANWSDEFTVTLTVPASGILWLTAGNWGSNDAFDAYVQLISVVDPNAPVASFDGTWTDGEHNVVIAGDKATFSGFKDDELDGITFNCTIAENVITVHNDGFNWGTIKLTVDGTSMAFASWGGNYTLTKQA